MAGEGGEGRCDWSHVVQIYLFIHDCRANLFHGGTTTHLPRLAFVSVSSPPPSAATRRHPQQVDYLAQTGSILALAGMLDEEDDADDYDEEDQAAFEELQALAAAAKAAKARGGGETKGDEPS